MNSYDKMDKKFEYEAEKFDKKHSDCMHDNCPTCGGTGNRKDGMGACIHMISCPCRKCTPTC